MNGEMFSTIASCFSTRRIHIGMDETHDLGTGAYLDRNGYRPRQEIFLEHLSRVAQLAEKYGLPVKPSQIIQPWQFGHNASKKTCLWWKGLPCLVPTNIVDAGEFVITGKDNKRYTEWLAWSKDENGKTIGWNDPRTAKLRSKTFPGIAKAMAEQWAGTAANGSVKDAWMHIEERLCRNEGFEFV
jgi:hypothetical protein